MTRRRTRSTVISMTLLVMAHDHHLRIRRLAHSRHRTAYRVTRMNKACRRCVALAARLLRSARRFRQEAGKLLAGDR
jgi:hypothetical protein